MTVGDQEDIQHRHYWGPGAICLGCNVRRCRKWHCNEPRRDDGGALCAMHAAAPSAGRPEAVPLVSQVVPLAPTLRILTFAWPAARREETLR
jgi:hypothetical protein